MENRGQNQQGQQREDTSRDNAKNSDSEKNRQGQDSTGAMDNDRGSNNR